MVLDSLGSSLKNTLSKIANAVFVDDTLINELVKDIQRALLQADVNVKLVFALSNQIKQRAKEEKLPKGLSKKEQLINIVYEELTEFMGGDATELKVENKKPFKIMLVGLYGSGKTTAAGKLSKYFATRGKKVAVVGLDVWRPAAAKQLEQNAKQANVAAFTLEKEKDPEKIYKTYEDKYNDYDILIVDTAGRDAISDELIEELKTINNIVDADETFLVISADIGQAAQKQAQTFHDTCGITGVIATKMDGTAKGGGALSACAVTKAPIKFIGVGERIDDLEKFNAKGFVGRLLGMGDLEALLEKAQLAISEEDAKDLGARMLKGEFNLIDLYEQMNAMKSMGSLGKLMEMIPGFGQMQIPKEALDVQDEKLKIWRFVMDSCTKKELEDPDIISVARIERIARGSGRTIQEVRDLLKQFKQSKKMVKLLKTGSPEKMMQKLQSGKMKKMKF